MHEVCGRSHVSPLITREYTTGTSLTFYGISFSCNTLASKYLSLLSLLHGVYGTTETKHDMALQGSPPSRSYTRLAPFLRTSKQPTSSALSSQAHQMLVISHPHTRGLRSTPTQQSSRISKTVGIGAVIRDHEGVVIVAMSKHLHLPLGPLEAEAKALDVVVSFA